MAFVARAAPSALQCLKQERAANPAWVTLAGLPMWAIVLGTVTTFLDWLAEQPCSAPLNLDALEDTVPDRWRDVLCSDLSHLAHLERRGSTFALSAPLEIESARHALQTKHAERAAADRIRLNQMTEYASFGECRTAVLLRYFGDSPTTEHCDQCDNCDEKHRRVVHREPTAHGVATRARERLS